MGLINPRPAMRGREERKVTSTLQAHDALMNEIAAAGVDRGEASNIAFAIVTSAKARKAIWRRKAVS